MFRLDVHNSLFVRIRGPAGLLDDESKRVGLILKPQLAFGTLGVAGIKEDTALE